MGQKYLHPHPPMHAAVHTKECTRLARAISVRMKGFASAVAIMMWPHGWDGRKQATNFGQTSGPEADGTHPCEWGRKERGGSFARFHHVRRGCDREKEKYDLWMFAYIWHGRPSWHAASCGLTGHNSASNNNNVIIGQWRPNLIFNKGGFTQCPIWSYVEQGCKEFRRCLNTDSPDKTKGKG